MTELKIKMSTVISAYLIACSFFMGGASAIQPYACPGDHGWKNVAMTLWAGATWPLVTTIYILGYQPHDTKCLNGDAFIRSSKQP